MNEYNWDETNPEHIILMLKEILAYLKKQNASKIEQ
jgi:hypothetical protein